jgi:hypothetical protein
MLIKLPNLTINNLKLQLKSRKFNKQSFYKEKSQSLFSTYYSLHAARNT